MKSFSVGDRIGIIAPRHPHTGESGTIVAEAVGGPRSVGLDWQVKLDHCRHGTDGCFVSEDEIRPDRRSTR